MTLDDALALAESRVGLLIFILLVLWVGAKDLPLWVFGKTHREAIARERARGDEWKDIATGGLQIADRAVAKLEQDS